MSRCFPYPPSGYVRNGASGEALIESIKLQRERENAKTERRKERKREKKKVKKDKGKEKPSIICDGEDKRLNDLKSQKGERSRLDSRGGHLQKRIEDEAEQLERSGLTEEHEQPICSANPCYSSDGTQNSNKRKRDTLPSNGNRNHGNIIRIRLALQKHKEPDASSNEEQLSTSTSGRTDSQAQQKYEISHLPSQKQCCCTSPGRTDSRGQQKYEISHVPSQKQCCSTSSGRTDSQAQQKYEIFPSQKQCCSTSTRTDIVPEEITPRPGRQLLCSTSGRTEIFTQDGAFSSVSKFEKKMQKTGSLYKALIESWVPPLLQIEQADYDDQQWLFETKPQDRHVAKRLKASNDASFYGSPLSRPSAHYLPEVDIYALPYTVPF